MTKKNRSEDCGCESTLRVENAIPLLMDYFQRLKLHPIHVKQAEEAIEHLHKLQKVFDRIRELSQ